MPAPAPPTRRSSARVAVLVGGPARRAGLRRRELAAAARRMLARLGVEGELSVALVDDAMIRDLNRRFRGVDRPTDVLAFPAAISPTGAGAPRLLGDVVISLDTAARQARGRRCLTAEVRMLLAHGILHLLGYDHERSAAEARRMFGLQRRLERLAAAPPTRLPAPAGRGI